MPERKTANQSFSLDDATEFYFLAAVKQSYMCTSFSVFSFIISEPPQDFVERMKRRIVYGLNNRMNIIGPAVPISRVVYEQLKKDALAARETFGRDGDDHSAFHALGNARAYVSNYLPWLKELLLPRDTD